MFEQINVHVQFNIERADAEELYDETEGHLALCIESVMERSHSAGIERILSPVALTGFLSEKLEKPEIKVESVEVITSACTLDKNVYVKIFAPNIWAIRYGKNLDNRDRLEDAVEYLKNPPKPVLTEKAPLIGTSIFNGQPVNPLIGSVYHDQLLNQMKLWDGKQWVGIQ